MTTARTHVRKSVRKRLGKAICKDMTSLQTNAQLTLEDVKNVFTYAGYTSPGGTLQYNLERKVVTPTTDNLYPRATILAIANKKLSKTKKTPLKKAPEQLQLHLDTEVKEFFIKAAKKKDMTVQALLTQHLNTLGRTKINDIKELVRTETKKLEDQMFDDMVGM